MNNTHYIVSIIKVWLHDSAIGYNVVTQKSFNFLLRDNVSFLQAYFVHPVVAFMGQSEWFCWWSLVYLFVFLLK